ncbi:hypothetical protein [Streptomyces nymphaeiformis]|uniref:Uncharacterized protein n=1 Tax=Streptomyces nymphaeiformis TaxID=2663842 RepID=A0A7W7U393_9ACTN|nr:hypothetical protein [Streptomyces nymphaeiformis]MBB4984194.1 hypothetical protein [Streptomyces nymphaeiformis]
MTPETGQIRIARGRGGEVEVDGPVDSFAGDVLRRAGFLFEPSLSGHWIRLPFDMGRGWENEHATWAAEMLAVARYPVRLAPDLHRDTAAATAPTRPARPPAMTAQAPPGRRAAR